MKCFEELFHILKEAKEKQSPKCKDGEEHHFELVFHSDAKEVFSYYYRCSKCKEVIV